MELFLLLKLFLLGFVLHQIYKRLSWYFTARKIYYGWVLLYCDEHGKDNEYLTAATTYFPIHYIFIHFWEKNLRPFVQYPELFDEVIQYINNKQILLYEKLLTLLESEFKSLETKVDKVLDNPDKKDTNG